MAKRNLALSQVYKLLEPGPVVMVTTARKGRPNVMTLSWLTMTDFEPPLVGIVMGEQFKTIGLTPVPAARVKPPLIKECFANLECKVIDARMAAKYNFFVLEVLKAWVDPSKKNPRTMSVIDN